MSWIYQITFLRSIISYKGKAGRDAAEQIYCSNSIKDLCCQDILNQTKQSQQRITCVKMKGRFPFHIHIIMLFDYQLP